MHQSRAPPPRGFVASLLSSVEIPIHEAVPLPQFFLLSCPLLRFLTYPLIGSCPDVSCRSPLGLLCPVVRDCEENFQPIWLFSSRCHVTLPSWRDRSGVSPGLCVFLATGFADVSLSPSRARMNRCFFFGLLFLSVASSHSILSSFIDCPCS